MSNMLRLLVLATLLFASGTLSLAETLNVTAEKLEARKNKDGKVVSVTKITSPETSFLIELTDQSHSAEKLRITPTDDEVELPFFSVALIDFDHDGYWDVEQTGACGNKVCEKKIYRFNPATKKFFLFFSGAYLEVAIFDKHLMESGASGCCAFEYHAYQIKNYQKPISPEKRYLIISVTSESDTKLPICTFKTSDGNLAKVPGKKWLDFCEHYGEKYKLHSKR
jgi:hypothetical protein